jgi:hypothetical protein
MGSAEFVLKLFDKKVLRHGFKTGEGELKARGVEDLEPRDNRRSGAYIGLGLKDFSLDENLEVIAFRVGDRGFERDEHQFGLALVST